VLLSFSELSERVKHAMLSNIRRQVAMFQGPKDPDDESLEAHEARRAFLIHTASSVRVNILFGLPTLLMAGMIWKGIFLSTMGFVLMLVLTHSAADSLASKIISLLGQKGRRVELEEALREAGCPEVALITSSYRVTHFRILTEPDTEDAQRPVKLFGAVLQPRFTKSEPFYCIFSNGSPWQFIIEPRVVENGGQLLVALRSTELREVVSIPMPEGRDMGTFDTWLQLVHSQIVYARARADVRVLKGLLKSL
jgi:hypothetical protein